MPIEALAGLRATFRAATETVVPEAASLDPVQWRELESIVDGALGARPAGTRLQFRAFVRALDAFALLRWGRTFHRLDGVRRDALLRRLQDAPLLLLRRGAWGLRTLALMGYYGRTAAAGEIGYRADVTRVMGA